MQSPVPIADVAMPGVEVLVTEPGGQSSEHRATVVGIGTRTIVATIKRFLYPGSYAIITLPDLYDAYENVEGTVTDCDYEGAKAHTITMRTKAELDVTRFVPVEAMPPEMVDHTEASLQVSVFHLTQRGLRKEMVAAALQATDATVTAFESGGELLGRIAVEDPGVCVIDLESCEADVEGFVASCRVSGCTGPIIAIAGRGADDPPEGVFEELIRLPARPEMIVTCIRKLLGNRREANTTTKTTLPPVVMSNPRALEMLTHYVDHCLTMLRDLSLLGPNAGPDAAREVMQEISDTALSYGVDALATAAMDAYKMINATASISESALTIGMVQRALRKLQHAIDEHAGSAKHRTVA